MKSNASPDFAALFERISAHFTPRTFGGLVCKRGFYRNCFVLKLQKEYWTNDPMDQVQNESGIFFSIWVKKDATDKGRARYNIHAFRLRALTGYAITSRDFAADFRKRFESVQDVWPNASTNYGPQTLMEGWIEFKPNGCEKEIVALMKRFGRLALVIDDLLAARRR